MAKTLTFNDLVSDDSAAAQQLLDYYDGQQQDYLVQALNAHRKDWKDRHIIPRVRNITKTIVDKSGLLFNAPPTLEIITDTSSKPVVDDMFNALMARSDWIEFFQNVDVYTRLLKSVCIYQQKYVASPTTTQDGKYVPNFQQGDALLLTLLSRANSAVVLDITGTMVIELAFLTSDIDPGGDFTYRDVTPDTISDWQVHNQKETLVDSKPNPDGFVPATLVYDTNKPRRGAWVSVPEDLVSLQEMVNLSLTDTEFAVAHQKQKTLFTNATVQGSKGGAGVMMGIPHAEEGYTPAGTAYPSNVAGGSNSEMGGLGNVVTVSAGDPSITPFIKFDGPQSDLDKLTAVMEDLAKQVAYDWSVTMRTEGSGKANSGFQIIVEEMDNLQLRDKRAQSMQAAMRRFYGVTQRLYPTLTAGMLRAKFAPANLPVNTAEEEQLWSTKIQEGRASVLDYFKETLGISDDEAWAKIEEIQMVNAKLGFVVKNTALEQATSPAAAAASSGGNPGSNPTGNP